METVKKTREADKNKYPDPAASLEFAKKIKEQFPWLSFDEVLTPIPSSKR